MTKTSGTPTRFLGLDFQPMETKAAVAWLTQTASAEADFLYVVTPNVDHRVRLQREPDLRGLYDGAGLVLNDSRILELLASFDRLSLPASPGADIVESLLKAVVKEDEPLVVIGCTASDIAALRAQFGIGDVRWHEAPMGMRDKPDAIDAAARFIADNPARFHLICIGSPQQEMVALAARQLGTARGIGLCCGASLDFLTGKTARAPLWMRQARLEWLHRMLSSPGRLIRRYLVDGPAIFAIWWRSR